MKVSYHNERSVGSAKHNDRNFDTDKAEHIDSNRKKFNRTTCVYPDMTFEEAEEKFYRENFAALIEETNARRKKNRHKNMMSVKSLLEGRNTKPEETIIQIGNIDEFPDDPKIITKLFGEICRYNNKITRQHGKILDAALHFDESTPHIHMRKVWVYEENGVKKIGQEKALKRAGIPLPYPDRPEGKDNNRKMTYDAMMRQRIQEFCKEHGLEIDIEPDKENNRHMTKFEFVNRQVRLAREKAEREREERRRRRAEEERGTK